MMIAAAVLVLISVCLPNSNEGARILGVLPSAAPSHYSLGKTLLKALAEAGHDVTMISAFSEKITPKKGSWREIILEGFIEDHQKQISNANMLQRESFHPLLTFFFTNMMGNQYVEKTLTQPNVQKLLKSNEKFDVVILSQFFNDGLMALAKHFDAHLVVLSTLGANVWNNHLVGNPSIPSFYPELILGYPPKMSFMQRVKTTMFRILQNLNLNLFVFPKHNQLIKKYISEEIDIHDVLSNVSLVLLNSHVSVSDPHPHVPNMIEIGGFHLRPAKELPRDLQKFLDDAKEGVIYFSMGSNLKSKDLPADMREAILKAFGKRKEKVLWKWEEDVLPGKPPNVFLSKWLPQQDLLVHPNLKVFITHGGLLSTLEAVYNGVPVITIPIFGDQKTNGLYAQQAGYGIVLPFSKLSEEEMTKTLDEIIYNPKYTENVKRRSKIMHNRKIQPLDEAIYWINYIIEFNGAPHLRVAYLHLNWYQYYCLDVFGFIFGIGILSFIIIKKLCSRLCRSNSKKLKEKSQ